MRLLRRNHKIVESKTCHVEIEDLQELQLVRGDAKYEHHHGG